MGWEYDGGEADFNAFVNQNSFEDNYDTNNSNKKIKSDFHSILNECELYEKKGLKTLHFKRFEKLVDRILPFLKDSNIYLHFDSKGDSITNRYKYEAEVKAKDAIMFRKRTELHYLRKALSVKYRTKEFRSLNDKRTHIFQCYFYDSNQNFDNRFILDMLSGRVKREYIDNSNILIRLMTIATLYESSNSDMYNEEFHLLDFYLEKKYSDTFISQDLDNNPLNQNPFWRYLDKKTNHTGMFRIIQKLGTVFDLIRSLKNNNLKVLPNFIVKLEKSKKKIRLESEEFVVTIEEYVDLLKKITFITTLYICKYDGVHKIMSSHSDESFTRLNKMSDLESSELSNIYKKNRVFKKKNINVDDLIKRGNALNSSYIDYYHIDKIMYLDKKELFKKSIRTGMMYSSELMLEIGSKIQINGFKLELLQREDHLIQLEFRNGHIGLGSQLIDDTKRLIGFNVYSHINEIEQLEDIILFVNNNLPSTEKNDYNVGDYLIIFDLYAEIKLDDLGYYYISPIDLHYYVQEGIHLKVRSFSSFFNFFDLDKSSYIKEILGYSLVSHNIICRSLNDINKIITQIQMKIINN